MLYTSLLTVHLIGLVLGLGAVSIGDLMMLRTLVRKGPAPGEALRDLSYVVWAGLAVLTASGLGLFALAPTTYIGNPGFLAKMVLVGILMLNGLVLHSRMDNFEISPSMLLVGAISSVSWYGAFVIAMFKDRVHLSLLDYLSIYFVAVMAVWYLYVRLHEHFDRAGMQSPSAVSNLLQVSHRQQEDPVLTRLRG